MNRCELGRASVDAAAMPLEKAPATKLAEKQAELKNVQAEKEKVLSRVGQ
jgi:hypothetical protein